MDYSRFRFVVVVDWVELEIQTLKPTQAKHLHAMGGGSFSHAHGINPQTGDKFPENRKNTTTTHFAVRIQAPERFAKIAAALATISDRLAPSAVITVRAMEVALDAYGNDTQLGGHGLAEMAAHFLKAINRVSEAHPRIYRRNRETRAISSHQELIAALQDGFQIGIGNGNGDRFQHGYFKTTDNQQQLADNECRARIEIRLQGKACPVNTLDDLEGFEFSSLSKYFRFKQFRELETDLQRRLAERQICHGNVIGNDGKLTTINREEGGTRKNKRGTMSSPLSEIARVRLRSLTKRWRAPTGRGKAREVDAIACGNSDPHDPVCVPEKPLENSCPQQQQNPCRHRGNCTSSIELESPSISVPINRLLNTSCSLYFIPETVASQPCFLSPLADNDLLNANYPPLPNLADEMAEI